MEGASLLEILTWVALSADNVTHICADNVTHIKISNKLTPSINYFLSIFLDLVVFQNNN
jgi:hypothetical protein